MNSSSSIAIVSTIIFYIGAVATSVFFLWVIAEFGQAMVNAFSAALSKAIGFPRYWRFYALMLEHRKRVRNLSEEERKKLSDFLSELFHD